MKKKKLLIALTAVLVFAMMSTTALGASKIIRGDLEIKLEQNSLTLEQGKSETVGFEACTGGESLWEDLQLPGCQMPECPTSCGEKDCLQESPYHVGVYDCVCAGREYETYETIINVKSSDESVVTVSCANHEITVTAVGTGSATITVDGELREWNDGQDTLAVTVTAGEGSGNPDNSESGNNGNSGNSGNNNSNNNNSGNGGFGNADDNRKPDDSKNDDNQSEVKNPANPIKFTDVADGFWAKEYIDALSAKGIIGGKTATSFAPNDTITRAEFVKILAGIAGADVSSVATSDFTDISAGAWYAPYVAWANLNGVAKGDSGKFSPDATISRQDIATMLYRYATDIAKQNLPDKVAAVDFADSGEIADYAKTAVQKLQKTGILGGKENNMFEPAATATRAEAAKMISIFINLG